MDDVSNESDLHSYALSGKVMCFSVVALLALLFLILCFHLYARFLSRRSTAAESQPRHPPSSCRRRRLLKSSGAHQQGLECAVCLSEFQAADKGRVLLDCRHCFHVDCIDTWFRSHSNCPLCRAPVDPTQNHDSRQIVSRVGEHCAGGNADGSDPDSDSILVQVECRRKAPPRWDCSAAPGLGQEGFAPRDPESGVLFRKR